MLRWMRSGWIGALEGISQTCLAGMTSVWLLVSLNVFTISLITGVAGCSIAVSPYSFHKPGSKCTRSSAPPSVSPKTNHWTAIDAPLKYGATYKHPAWLAASACGTENRVVASVRMPVFSRYAIATMLSGVAGILMHTRSLPCRALAAFWTAASQSEQAREAAHTWVCRGRRR